MAWIISWQFIGWPDSWSTLAAASKALSLLAASSLALASVLALAVFLALGVLVRWATPGAALRLVQRSLRPLAEPWAAAASAAALVTLATADAPLASGWVVLLLVLAMSGLP